MYVTDEVYEEAFHSSETFDFYFGEARLGVFDIETTGLGAGRSKIILGGLLTPCGGGVRVRQFFAEGVHEEGELLALYTEALSETDVLFSYNGDRFDIPFVNERLAKRLRPPAFGDCLSVDVYRVLRKHSVLGDAPPDLKQKTVEAHLGLGHARTDRIAGADSVRLYYEYVASKSPKLLQYILLHNSDDLLQLARILRVFGRSDLHEIAAHTGFPVKCGESLALITDIKLGRRVLEFSGKYKALPFDYILFDEPWRISFQNETESFCVRVPCLCEKDLVFVDLRELGADDGEFASCEAYGDGYLALKQGSKMHYGPMNRLVKRITRTALARFAR
ncbi:MAG: ribonuclease H-like domain-containing protein [Clostridiales Family XIII bacterium]|jgi:uncharacterized protein YprB with RNaseH-like and TPR domain|nr:ribonuclease H-like domain-containing protein [Clostridiales Family XIII bacterium]